MKFSYILFYYCILIFSIYGSQLVISQSGQYSLGASIAYVSSANDSIIKIAANDVLLDLNNNFLSQSGSGTVHGIEVNANLSNIMIRNGTIRNISGTGILINSGCQNIIIENVQTLTLNRGISLLSSTNAPIKNCRVMNIGVQFATDAAIFVGSAARNIILDTLLLDNCSTTTSAILFSGTALGRCTGNLLQNIFITGCGSGIQLLNTDNSIIKNCRILGESNTVNSFNGIHIQGVAGNQAKGNIIKNCTVENVTSVGENAAFNFQEVLGACVSNCFAANLLSTTTAVIGYNINSGVNNGSRAVVLNQCNATSLNVLSSQILFGCILTNASSCVVKNSVWTSLVGKNSNTNRSGAIIANFSDFSTIKNSKSENTSFSGYTSYNSNSTIIANCIAIDSYNTAGNSYVSTAFLGFASANTMFDNCISCSQSANNTSGGFYLYGDVNSIISNCISNGTDDTGFTINIASGQNCFVQNCTATNAGVYGFQVLANPAVLYNNTATNCTTAGFFQSTPIDNSRYFLNQATNNGTNYSGPIPTLRTQGQRKKQGGNLDI